MTRINAGIPVANLIDSHLLAEHREITRVIGLSLKSNQITNVQKFTLGTGHVKFFYDKLDYIYSRYNELYNECVRRGFEVQNKSEMFSFTLNSPLPCLKESGWQPSKDDRDLLENRIIMRLVKSKGSRRYCGNILDINQAVELLTK